MKGFVYRFLEIIVELNVKYGITSPILVQFQPELDY